MSSNAPSRPPSSPEAPESPRPGGTHPLLLAAARRVLRGWSADAADPASPGLELHGVLLSLVAAVEHPQASQIYPVMDPAVSLQFLERLRSELMAGWSRRRGTSAPADETLLLLSNLEEVQARLRERMPERAGPTLFGIPYTPDLVVELAHDLRSPLTSILFLSETLRRGQSGHVSDLQHRQLGIIYSAALNLVSMAGDVIELARGGERLLERHPSPFSMSEMVTSIFDLVEPMAEERHVKLRWLPARRDQFLGHPVPLSRVLLNLTTNALKATEDGLVEITIREEGVSRVAFAVRDTGRGIDEEARQHLFEPFRTYDTGSSIAFSGSGLGLSICNKLVAAMGGTLEFETSPEWGTRFFFTLDLSPVDLR